MKTLKQYLLILCLGLSATACLKDDNDSPIIDQSTMHDIVTFVGNPESNNHNSVFQFQKEGDSRLTTLRANNIALDTALTKVNSRVLLAYTPETGIHNIDDNITVNSVASVFNDSIRTGELNRLPNPNYNPIFVDIIQRSGTYLNIQCGLTYIIEPLEFMLMIDASTIDNEMPDVYLSYKKDNNKNASYKGFIASIDIANLWNRPTCKGFTLHVNDSNFGNNKIEFKKITLTPMQ